MIESEDLDGNEMFGEFLRCKDQLVHEYVAARREYDRLMIGNSQRLDSKILEEERLARKTGKAARSGNQSRPRRFGAGEEGFGDDGELFSGNNMTILICVPQSLSLREEQTVGLVRSHILIPVKESQGQFMTMDSQRILISGSHIMVHNSNTKNKNNKRRLPTFDFGGSDSSSDVDSDEFLDRLDAHHNKIIPPWDDRTIRVIYTEDLRMTFINTNGEETEFGLKILHVDRPIRGGCKGSCTLEGLDLRQIRQYLCILKLFPENQVSFDKLDSFIDSIRNRQVSEEEQLKRLLKYWVFQISSTILQSNHVFERLFGSEGAVFKQPRWYQFWKSSTEVAANNNNLFSQKKRHSLMIQQAIEAYVLEGSYDSLMAPLYSKFQREDRKFQEMTAQLRSMNINQQDIGIRPEYQCPQVAAMEMLSQLGSKHTALEKLLCIDRVVALVNDSVESNIRRHFQDISAFQLTTDDLLDQLIYVVIRTPHLANIFSQIHFIRTYHTINVNMTSLGYNLANLEVALRWVISSEENNTIANDTIAQVVERRAREMDAKKNLSSNKSDVVHENASNQYKEISQTEMDGVPSTEYFVFMEASRSASELVQAVQNMGGSGGGLELGPGVFEGVEQFACSKFTPDLYCWIVNGRVKVSTGMHHSVLSRQRFRKVACGENHMLAVSELGQLYAWGENHDGQVGVGDRKVDRCTSPVLVKIGNRDRKHQPIVIDAACGARHSMVLTETRHVWTWGRGNCGRLGHASVDSENAPRKIEAFPPLAKIESICAGWSHSLALTTSGHVYSWGCGSDGRLGIGSFSDKFVPTLMNFSLFRYDPAVKIAAGFCHTCILTKSGVVMTCGGGSLGQLGFGPSMLPDSVSKTDSSSPRSGASLTDKIQNFMPISLPFARPSSSLHISTNDEASPNSVGIVQMERVETPKGQPFKRKESVRGPFFLKNGTGGSVCLVPQPVQTLQSIKVTAIDCGKYSTAVVTENSDVYVWGFEEKDGLIISEPVLFKNVVPGAADSVICGANTNYICYGQEVLTSFSNNTSTNNTN